MEVRSKGCAWQDHCCNAPILIFDEPTSALDKSLELRFFSKLKFLLKNKIIIVVTHNLDAIPGVTKFIIWKI